MLQQELGRRFDFCPWRDCDHGLRHDLGYLHTPNADASSQVATCTGGLAMTGRSTPDPPLGWPARTPDCRLRRQWSGSATLALTSFGAKSSRVSGPFVSLGAPETSPADRCGIDGNPVVMLTRR